MGALLSRIPPMELRREEGARTESYNMLLESEGTPRSQRALKRELCFTRAAVLVLVLVLGLCLCLMYFMQFPPCKDRGHDGKTNGDQNQLAQAQIASLDSDPNHPVSDPQIGNQDDQRDDESDPKQPLSASLRVNCTAISEPYNGNITWMKKQDLTGFTLQDSKSLVVAKYGMYRISLQVTYRNIDTTKKPTKEPEKIVLSHRVLLYYQGYPGNPRPVLEVYESVYWKDFMWIKTKYSEDVFTLDRGTIIRVESSNLNYIHCGASFLSVRYEPTD